MPDSLRQFKATMFQALAHPTRIAILELLRDGELPVATIVERLKVEPANASQHFAVLRAKHIVTNRKEGNQVFYSVRDPLIIEVLNIMRQYFQAHLEESLSLLKYPDQEAYRSERREVLQESLSVLKQKNLEADRAKRGGPKVSA